MNDLPIVAAGREIPDGLDRIRRYCGLSWSGGEPETWAWRYYDVIPAPMTMWSPRLMWFVKATL